MKKSTPPPVRIERCFSIRSGIDALSPSLTCRYPKTAASNPAPIKSPMIVEELQDFD
jgi:hypothetical protein